MGPRIRAFASIPLHINYMLIIDLGQRYKLMSAMVSSDVVVAYKFNLEAFTCISAGVDALSNVLIPVFLGDPKTPVGGKKARVIYNEVNCARHVGEIDIRI
ncbi:hypothetical protein E8E13_001155 [Curvularia kusanoi]|uniref:Uncharacterized protein n=1 Tax=Curvularia kusanoi TaxID=90978 RepID=A0A9P4T965_CURKU|nr:hypothetical protein E8E13_001155 [Curvularia kusanoi]